MMRPGQGAGDPKKTWPDDTGLVEARGSTEEKYSVIRCSTLSIV